jgi:hypothetical protein
MLSEADLIAKRAALRWLAKLHPEWTHQDLAEALDISRLWVSKWRKLLRRADPDDVMALHSRSYARRTPPFSIASQPAVVQRLLQIRVEPPELCWLHKISVEKIESFSSSITWFIDD